MLEGSALSGGFTQITTRNERNLTRIIAGLGERFCISDVYFKPYTACRHTHGAAQAALSLVGKEHFDPHQIDAVHVHTYPIAALAVGRSVSAGDTFVSAQFSLPYVVAACLVDKGMGPAQLSAARIGDPVILDLAGKVRIEVDPELAAAYPDKTSTRVAITLVGGRVLTQQIDIPKGDPRDPMTAGHLTDKLKRFATGRNDVDVDRIASVVLALESVSDVRELTALV